MNQKEYPLASGNIHDVPIREPTSVVIGCIKTLLTLPHFYRTLKQLYILSFLDKRLDFKMKIKPKDI